MRPAHMRRASLDSAPVAPSAAEVIQAFQQSVADRPTWGNPKGGLVFTEALQSVTYFPSVKFKEPLAPGYRRSPYEICSIAENRIVTLSKDVDLVTRQIVHNATWITRIYPDGIRQNSSNLDPSIPWSCGSQMVCLNFHNWDLPMRLNMAKFRCNGMCGYVLKPSYMLSDQIALSNAPSSLPPSPPSLPSPPPPPP